MADLSVRVGSGRYPVSYTGAPAVDTYSRALDETLHLAANTVDVVWPGSDAIEAARLPYGGTWDGIVGVQDVDPLTFTKHNVSTANGGDNTTGTMQTTATTAQINAALVAAPANSYVELEAGTFTITTNLLLQQDRKELRGTVDGNGLPATILNFSNSGDNLTISVGSNWDHYYYASNGAWSTRNLTAVPSRGATSVTATATLTGGAGGTPTIGGLMAISAPQNAPTIDVEVAEFSQLFSESGSGARRPWMQIVQITGVTLGTNTITFFPAVNADYLSGTIQIHWRPIASQLNYSGIRHLQFQVTGAGRFNGGNGSAVQFSGNNQCWIDNCFFEGHEGGATINTAVQFYFCYGCELTHSRIRNAPSTQSSMYGVSIYGASSLLIVNNHITQVPNSIMILNLSGSVIGYNYCHDNRYGSFNSQWVFLHGSHNHYNLFEGNWLSGHYNDEIEGSNSTHSRNCTYVRERMTAWDSADGANGASGTTENNVCLTQHLHHDQTTVAACVLGTTGKQSGYENFPSSPSTTSLGYIFRIDTTTNATLDRLGNYNYFNSAIPAAETTALAGGTIATSYIYPSRPSWYGASLPWPWCAPSNPSQSNDPENLPAGYRAINGTDAS